MEPFCLTSQPALPANKEGVLRVQPSLHCWTMLILSALPLILSILAFSQEMSSQTTLCCLLLPERIELGLDTAFWVVLYAFGIWTHFWIGSVLQVKTVHPQSQHCPTVLDHILASFVTSPPFPFPFLPHTVPSPFPCLHQHSPTYRECFRQGYHMVSSSLGTCLCSTVSLNFPHFHCNLLPPSLLLPFWLLPFFFSFMFLYFFIFFFLLCLSCSSHSGCPRGELPQPSQASTGPSPRHRWVPLLQFLFH